MAEENSVVTSLLPTLQDPNVQKFLNLISQAEGTDTHGYNTLFGGGRVESLADHPRQLFDFKETTGNPNKTSAAGRYQFLQGTWDEQAKKLGLPDFGPQSQDLAAVNLLRERGILPHILQGDFDTAVNKSGKIWASLPSSTYAQPKRSMDFVNKALATGPVTSDVNPVAMSTSTAPDFSKLSDEQLASMFQSRGGAPVQTNNLDKLSDEQLMQLYQKQPQVEAPKNSNAPRSWSNTLTNAVTNIPSSAGKFAGDIYHAVTNPVETGKNLGMVLAGGMKNLMPESVQKFITSISSEPGQIDKAVEMANAVGGEYAKKYGSMEGFKNALATDPVGTAADVSMLFTGGGSVASKLPGVAGRAGEAVANVGRTIDPLNIAVNAVSKPAKLAEALASNTLGLSTGAGAESIREAAKAGAAGGAKAEAFLDQMRANAPIENVVNTARDAVAEMYKNRSDLYKSSMSGVTKDKTTLDFAPIDKSIADAERIGSFHGIAINENAAKTLADIRSKFDEFKASPVSDIRTVEGFDKLKQAIGDIQQAQPLGTPARTIANEIYNSVKNEITKQAPDYAKVMKDYENASALLKDIESSLSTGKKANIDTTVRKLQSIMRNNANTNYGRRAELGRVLEQSGAAGADTLFPQIAGQMLSSKTPRGIQGGVLPASMGGAALTAGLTNPATAAAIIGGGLASSPRLVGEAAYYAGKAGGSAQKVAEALKSFTGKSPIDPYTLRMLAAKLGQMRPEDQR